MHPRNRYRENKPDFGELAKHRPSLQPYLIQKKRNVAPEPAPYSYTLDFSNPHALRELACAVLSRDFGLDVVLPVDRLVPMVPQRLNYIHWLEDLLQEERQTEKQIFGIDIGTGASCIYPLLGTAMNDSWRFLATEIDDASVQCAMDNVQRNNLQDRITIVKVSASTTVIGAVCEDRHYDFVMCNPPFYEDNKDKYEGAQRTMHRPAPPTFNTGCEEETVTGGGELGFMRRILHDSLILRTRIQWYTSMLGKKTTLKTICRELKQHKIPIVTTSRFIQGKTHRWAVAWSFDETQEHKASLDAVALGTKSRKHSQLLVLTVPYNEDEDTAEEAMERVSHQLHTTFTELEIDFREEEREGETTRGRQWVCEAHRNTWSQQRKRRRLKQRLQQMAESGHSIKATQVGVEGVKGEERTGSQKVTSNPGTHSTSSSGNDPESCHFDLIGETQTQPEHSAAGCSESPGNEQQYYIRRQIETLNSPCHVQFSCEVCVSCSSAQLQLSKDGLLPSGKKKARLCEAPTQTIAAHNERENSILLTFEWIRGDNRDLLHQVVQYLRNTNFKH